jgi:hypothetical protein
MRIASRGAAPRNGLAAILVALLLQASPALAEGAPELILPLVTAIAVASAASKVPRQVATIEPGRRPLLSLLPSQMHIEDGYGIDVDDYIGRRRPVALIDEDRLASYDVLRRPRHGWMMTFSYNEESRGPLSTKGELLLIELKREF